MDKFASYLQVIRGFLLAVLDVMGLGSGFHRWVNLLLTSTGACALVNGYLSAWHPYTAGVRQGCPLSPQLYLLVAQALLCFLKANGIGIHVFSRSFVASQFADDAQIYLQGPAAVPPFLAVMGVFEAASGQKLNLTKSLLLPIGKAGRIAIWLQYVLPRLRMRFPQQPIAMLTVRKLALRSITQRIAADPSAIPAETSLCGLRVVGSAWTTFSGRWLYFCGLAAQAR